jgi:hypothetical protein
MVTLNLDRQVQPNPARSALMGAKFERVTLTVDLSQDHLKVGDYGAIQECLTACISGRVAHNQRCIEYILHGYL